MRAVKRVANTRLFRVLHGGNEPSHLAFAQDRHRHRLGMVEAQVQYFVPLATVVRLDHIALPHSAVHDAYEGNHATILVVPAVKHERAQTWRLSILPLHAWERRRALDEGLEHSIHALARLCTHMERRMYGGIHAKNVSKLLRTLLRVRGGQVDLVQDRNHGQSTLFSNPVHGNGLRLNTLCRIYHQQSRLTHRERAAHLVGKVDVARRIDQIEEKRFRTLRRLVQHAHSLRFDSDATITLDFELIENLFVGCMARNGVCALQESIGECRFSMVNMRNDRKRACLKLIIGYRCLL